MAKLHTHRRCCARAGATRCAASRRRRGSCSTSTATPSPWPPSSRRPNRSPVRVCVFFSLSPFRSNQSVSQSITSVFLLLWASGRRAPSPAAFQPKGPPTHPLTHPPSTPLFTPATTALLSGNGLSSRGAPPKFILVLFPGDKTGREIQAAAGTNVEVNRQAGRQAGRKEGGGGGGCV